MPEDPICVRASLAADEVIFGNGNGREFDVYEEGGCGEGCAVEGGDFGCEDRFLFWKEGEGVLDFVEGHFEGVGIEGG